jgi:hypothetical protein
MAIKFDEFSHYSHPAHFSGDLPAYDVGGGDEVYYYWRSAYDPTLTYLYNISSSNDYYISGTYGYGRTIWNSTGGNSAGIKYARFIQDGYYNNVTVTRDSGYANLSGGSGSGSSFGYMPAVEATIGYHSWYLRDWQLEASGTVYTDVAHRYPVRKVLKHGRLYLMYCGGSFNYDPYTSQGAIRKSDGHFVNTYFAGTNVVGQDRTFVLPFPDEPELHIYDARYLPGTSYSILRDSEASIFNPSPVIGINDKGGCTASGIATYHGISVITPSHNDFNGGTKEWGPDATFCNVGHLWTWGKVFAVGDGQMMFSTAHRAAEMWSVTGEKNAISAKAQGYYVHLFPWFGGYTNQTDNSGEWSDGRQELSNIYKGDTGEAAFQPPLFLKNGKIAYFSRWNLARFADTHDSSGSSNQIFVHNSHDFRVRIRLGDPGTSGQYGTDDHSQEVFAVGNGRLYSLRFHGRTTYSGPGYLNNFDGAAPYYHLPPSFLRANYSVEIFDLCGVPRKTSWAVNGGTLLNNTATTQSGNANDRRPIKMGPVNRIVAGCGRVLFAYTDHYQVNDANFNFETPYGKAFLYTQDGAFIKTLSFKDDMWGYFGTALNKNIKFGFKIEIANNLIFVMTPYFDLSDWTTGWGGKGRMYIYSLDGELLAAFSPFNLGFTSSFPFNFTDFVTDGVNLFIFNNQVEEYAYWNNTFYYKTPGLIPVNELNQLYSTDDTDNAGGSWIYKRNKRPLVMHLKLPETLDHYYDNIVETYRY